MKIGLIYAAKPTYGGWPSFTAHLALQLQAMGHEVSLFKAGNRTENKQRDFGRGLMYQNLSPEALCLVPNPIFTAVDKDGIAHAQALAGRAVYVMHDPTELSPEFAAVLKQSSVVAIREANLPHLSKAGIVARYIPHPYQAFPRSNLSMVKHRWNAVAVSRIDWDKHTAIIAEANEQLSEVERVEIFGACNRMYEHHKLSKFANWRANYHGRFETALDAAVRLCEQARYMVDLSVIAGDGGGSQYTFLEAWNARVHLVVNRAWMRPNSELVEGFNCTSVANAAELIERLRRVPDPAVVQRGAETLLAHCAEVVVPQYLEALT